MFATSVFNKQRSIVRTKLRYMYIPNTLLNNQSNWRDRGFSFSFLFSKLSEELTFSVYLLGLRFLFLLISLAEVKEVEKKRKDQLNLRISILTLFL